MHVEISSRQDLVIKSEGIEYNVLLFAKQKSLLFSFSKTHGVFCRVVSLTMYCFLYDK